MRDKDLPSLAALTAPAVLLPLALYLAGRSLFWGDLSYLHHPWRALTAGMIQQGRLPLWDPYAYLGMPLAAEMQCASWYPGTIPFYLFSFSGALAVYLAVHYALAGFFAYLWLRAEKLPRASAFAGAAMFTGCGSLISRAPFLNHLSTLAYLPAFLLLRRKPALLALAFALAFLSGYPLMMGGAALMALVLPWALGEDPAPRGIWVAAAALSAGLGACLLLPAAELVARSHRGAGLSLADTLTFGLSPGDWRQWISPLAVPAGDYSPSVYWWKTCYLGFFSWVAIALAVPKLSRRARLALGAILACVLCLLLGRSNAVSLWLWSHLPPLHYVRYPGNLAYLALPALALLVAVGLRGKAWAGGFALALGVELLIYAAFSQPTMPSVDYTSAGPLVRELQNDPGHRYLISPNALHLQRMAGPRDLQWRLYGLTNLSFHLSAIGNFGEPLVPLRNYEFMDFIFSRPSIDAAAPYLKWLDAPWVLTRDRLSSSDLNYQGLIVWHRYRVPGELSRAAWFSPSEGEAIPAAMVEPADLPAAKADWLAVDRPREDRLRIQAKTRAGWLYLAEPRYPGWEARLNGRPVAPEPALGVFQKFRVPEGSWDFSLRYAPRTWNGGILLTLGFLLATAAYWYNRGRRETMD